MKIVKKTEAKKTGTKAVKAPKSKAHPEPKRKVKDDARFVAAQSDGELNTDQIRVLRAMAHGRPVLMVQIKAYVGLAPEQKYSGKFLAGIHDLVARKLVRCDKHEDSRAFQYTIMAKGKDLLKESQQAAKVAERLAAKE